MADDPGARQLQEASTSSLTIVRIKRRRDDPAAPEIILEAAGVPRSKQPRYDEVLLQFQGLSVLGAATAAAADVPRRRFRRLRTVDVSVLESMTETELLQLLRTQSGAAASTSAAPPARDPAAGPAGAGAAGDEERLAGLPQAPGQRPREGEGEGSQEQRGQLPRRGGKGGQAPSRDSRVAALRTSHKQSAVAARYKQIRRKRESTVGDGEEEASLYQMYDLERLPATLASNGRRATGARHAAQASKQQEQRQQPEQPSTSAVPPPPLQPQPQAGGMAAPATPEEVLIQQRYAPLVDEYLHSLSQQQPEAVKRIPARPKRAQATPPKAQQQPPAAPQTQHSPPPLPSGAANTSAAVPAAPLPPGTSTAAGATGGAYGSAATEHVTGDEAHAFVYDVYVPVPDDMEGGQEGDEGDPWPWLDAPTGVDLAAPVIEVAENDDEFFWAGELEDEAAQRAAAVEEHDSEDSNAESYYANSYPDEEDAPYGGRGNDAATDGDDDDDEEDEEAEPADADAGACGWGVAVGMRRRGALSDDDDEEDEGDEDEEIFGRRCRRARPAKKVSSYFRTENDDYSEHSSFMSEEEDQREAEERRRRAIFMH